MEMMCACPSALRLCKCGMSVQNVIGERGGQLGPTGAQQAPRGGGWGPLLATPGATNYCIVYFAVTEKLQAAGGSAQPNMATMAIIAAVPCSRASAKPCRQPVTQALQLHRQAPPPFPCQRLVLGGGRLCGGRRRPGAPLPQAPLPLRCRLARRQQQRWVCKAGGDPSPTGGEQPQQPAAAPAEPGTLWYSTCSVSLPAWMSHI